MRRLAACCLLGLLAPALGAAPLPAERDLLDRVNEVRAGHGLAPLAWDDRLADAARAHVVDMAAQGLTTHVSRDGATLETRIARADARVVRAGENVGQAPDLERGHDALLDSPPHLATILDPEFGIAGFAVLAEDGGSTWIVQDFAVAAPEFPPEEAAAEVLSLVIPEWAPGIDPALSRDLDAFARDMAARDEARPDAERHGACWMVAYVAGDPREVPPACRPGCSARSAGVGVAWARTPSRPLGAFFVAIALRK